MNTINKNTQVLLDACREDGLEGNVEKTKYMVASHHQNVGQSHNLLIANKSFKMWQSSVLGKNNNKSNSIHREIKSRLNSGNAGYYSIQSLFPILLTKSFMSKIYKTINLPFFVWV